jgi:selenocysteine lyase/cysteine desulfurase
MRIKDVRSLFPIVKSTLYFDAASLTPYCIPVIEAQQNFMRERREFGSLYFDRWKSEIEECRKLAADLLKAHPSEVALTKNTTEGVNLTSRLVDWQKGDEVLVCDCDFPTNIYPFLNLKEEGVNVRYVKCKEGKIHLEDLERALSNKTKLLSISHVFYNSGYRVNLEEVGQLCSDKGVLLHVDAAQSLGAFKIDVRRAQIDFLSATGFKWLLSPLGTGLFYVNKKHLHKTPILGWLSVKDPDKLDTRAFELLPSAKRFEGGTKNIGGYLGMLAALKLIHSIGSKEIEEKVLEISQTLGEELKTSGQELISEMDDEHRSGIICIKKRVVTDDFLRKYCIVATIRKNLRFSPHIYNDEEDVSKLIKILSNR